MHMLITGGAGFIGSHLAEVAVGLKHKVAIIDNLGNGRLKNLEKIQNEIKFVKADIATSGAWQSEFKGVDVVVHLAALADIVPSIQDPSAYYQSNVTGTLNVLEAARGAGVKKFIYAASASCYGQTPEIPTAESSLICPEYPYALTKRLGEELVLHWGKIYGLNVCSLRFFNVYGPRSRTNGTYGAMFGVFLAQKLANQPFTVIGDGTQSRDFTHVADLTRAIVLACEQRESMMIYNVGSGVAVSVKRVVELLGGPVVYIPKRPGEPDKTVANINKIKKDLGFTPRVTIEAGVQDMLKHISYWKSAPVWNKNSIAEATKDWFKFLNK